MTPQEKNERLLEKIVAHFTERIRAGKPPSIGDYERKYPELKNEIRELLSSVAMIEELKQTTESETSSRSNPYDRLNLQTIGDYRIVRELGRGGMGVVLEAVHESLGRKVAIKVMPDSPSQNDRHLERFRREAEAAANLHHTNIVSVFGVGQHKGHQYYVMEFVDGQNLSHVIRQLSALPRNVPPQGTVTGDTLAGSSPSTVTQRHDRTVIQKREATTTLNPENDKTAHYRWAAELGVQIADALAHAHQHGILHRDIKPANLLLDPKNVCWVTDFGLVKNTLHQTLTQTGDVVGTPQYMAPESFEGAYDARSETYCLGLTLYELVTLQPAFKEKTTHELIRKITTSAPEPLRKIAPSIPRDLNTIIEKSIQRDPADRYASAGELRDDLRAFLSDRPIHARRSDPLEQAWRWTRRNPLVASLMAASILLICLVAITATLSYQATKNAFHQLSIENQKLIIAESKITAEQQLANDNFEQMKLQFNRAEQNLAITLEMLDQMFDQMLLEDSTADSNLEIEGFEDLSELTTSVTAEDAQFLERLLVFYERFTAQNLDNKDLIFETASAYRRVANIYQLIGEADRAIPAYQETLNIYQKLLDETAVSDKQQMRELTLAIARTRNDWAMLQSNTRDRVQSETKLKTSVLELEALGTNHPDVKYELGKTLYQLASTPLRTNSPERHPPNARRRPNHRGRRFAGPGFDGPNPLSAGAKRPEEKQRRDSERPLSERRRFKHDCAVRAAVVFEELLNSNPSNPEYGLYHAKTLMQLANSEYKTTDQQGELLRQAQQELKELSERYPDNPEYQYVIGAFYFHRAKPGDTEAIANMERAKEIGRELHEAYPEKIRYRQLYAMACYHLGRQYHRVGEIQKSLGNQKIAFSMWQDLSNETDDIRYFYQKNTYQLGLARDWHQQGKYSDAKRLVEQAIQELQSVEIHELAKRHSKRFQRERSSASQTQLLGRWPGGRMTEELFWEHHKELLVDHYTLLGRVNEQQGDTTGSAEATRKIKELSETNVQQGFPNAP